MMKAFIQEELDILTQNSLKRDLKIVSGSQGREIIISNKKVLNFCSNNYLGLADDPRLVSAASRSMEQEGFGSGASRLVCGNMSAHHQLEKTIARFKRAESCLLFSTGYMANVGIISAMFKRGDVIFSDKLNHSSITDGIILSRAAFKRYQHNDMHSLEAALSSAAGFKKRCIVTDSVFSMDGDIAPLDRIVELASRYGCFVMIDEAHALGVMGENGRGLAEHFGLEKNIDIQMGTLSKAAGSFGSYCCGPKGLIDFFINKARSFIYTTGMPPSVAAASQKAIEIIEADRLLRSKLWKNTHYIHGRLKAEGFNTMDSSTPIIPILVKSTKVALEFSRRLFERGIFISAIRPPAVPRNMARLRLTVMATHTRGDLDFVLEQMKKTGGELCLI